MVVPVGEQAREQVGAAQERRIGGARPAEREVVAAAGAGVPAVEHELLGGEARLRAPARRGTRCSPTSSSQLAAGWMLTSSTPGSGVTRKRLEPRVVRRLVAFEHHREAELGGGCLDRADELEIVLERFERRHEDVEHAVARLGAERRARDPGRPIRTAAAVALARRYSPELAVEAAVCRVGRQRPRTAASDPGRAAWGGRSAAAHGSESSGRR